MNSRGGDGDVPPSPLGPDVPHPHSRPQPFLLLKVGLVKQRVPVGKSELGEVGPSPGSCDSVTRRLSEFEDLSLIPPGK